MWDRAGHSTENKPELTSKASDLMKASDDEVVWPEKSDKKKSSTIVHRTALKHSHIGLFKL